MHILKSGHAVDPVIAVAEWWHCCTTEVSIAHFHCSNYKGWSWRLGSGKNDSYDFQGTRSCFGNKYNFPLNVSEDTYFLIILLFDIKIAEKNTI